MEAVLVDRVYFKVNGVTHSVGHEVSSDVMLVDYLRSWLELRGTKYMCREGGCGACCVSVRKYTGGPVVSVNSCLVSIASCQDWEITTIEEIGNRRKGYHVLQKTLAEYNGTQCGFCTPAWIQNMYSLLQNGNKPTMLEIEKSFGNNVCRCTGYRPILDAFKKFGSDAPKEKQILDIEDLSICKKTGAACDKKKCDDGDDDWCIVSDEEVRESKIIEIKLKDDRFWYKVYDIKSIFDVLNVHGYDSYMLVYGNTARGAYPIFEYPRVMIDVTTVPELKSCIYGQNLVLGMGITLTEFLNVLKAASKQQYFGYLEKFVEHINLVASIPIRNLGSIGGNLMIKHQHNEFPSDLFLLFETVGAYLTIYTAHGVSKKLSMQQFLKEDMKGKIIVDVMLPPLNDQHKLVTYKIMPRSQFAHAIVNAGFVYNIASNNTVIGCRIVYGGLSPTFIRAEATEKFLIGKKLFSNTVLQAALNILENELVIADNPPAASVRYRKQLSLSLFFKGLLSICPKGMLNERYLSATTKIHETRLVSEGKQIFETNPTLWPLNQPIPKVEALIQCAGETTYTDDLQVQPREVHAAFVLSTVAVGDIVQIDATRALKQPGVIAFYKASDIPGENTYIPAGTPFFLANEEILASTKVQYLNQPIGIIVAESHHIANQAAKLVTATYTNVKSPVTDIKVAVKDKSRSTLFMAKPATEKGTDVVKTIKGQDTIYGQLHFMMENMSCVTRPTEEGLECHVTSQWLDGCQLMISKALNMDASKIDVHVRRLGGAYGIKISRPNQIAIASSLVVQKLNRACRFVVPLTTCTRAIGKRLPCHTDYEAEVNAKGVIQSIKYKEYEDNGYVIDETLSFLGSDVYNNCYTNTKWDFELYDTLTDTASNTWCRSPGTLESISLAEYVLERISYELSLDPIDVRLANLDTKYNDLVSMAETLRTSASYAERKAKVAKFNKENRWRKRGIRCSFLRWTPAGALRFEVNLSICHGDGTVIITHGGIEMGQGINTKAVQICAYYFKIPIDKIQIKANNTIIAPNCFATGGSLGSQNVGVGVRRCCEAMLERLAPIRTELGNPTWLELILKAYDSNIDLQIHSYVGVTDVYNYDIFGVAIAEAEVDVLTGESEILRVDILQDVGQSVSPEVDIGQVEGAFIMGMGYWTCEDLVYNRTTGELLTDRTWDYHVPLARDIPQDFRVTFRKNSYSLEAVMGAKATGEPPLCLSIVIAFALREAIAEARKEVGIPTTSWFGIEGPYTVELIGLASGVRKADFKFT